MTEPAIKTRTLKKVRREFLHKRPPDDEDLGQHADLPTTPEQLNESPTRLLESSLGLVETNRTIQVGWHLLNSHYNVRTVKIQGQAKSKAVVLCLQTNHVDILPWEYCAKRLESYGDLELATWATRLKTYRETYPNLINTYNALVKPKDPESMAIAAKETENSSISSRFIESTHPFCKITVYATKNGMIPVSLTYNEGMLKDMGHNVDSFGDWVRENGIPGLFGDNCFMEKELSKYYLSTKEMQFPFFQQGPEFSVDLIDKEGAKKTIKVTFFFAIEAAPEGTEGFFANAYYVQKDVELNKAVTIEEEVKENKGFGGISAFFDEKNLDLTQSCKQIKGENLKETSAA